MLRVETWKHGWRWVYSVTYDEDVRSLLDHALPLHRQHDMPGTVALAAELLADGGQLRLSSRGSERERYLSVGEIRELQRHGWSIASAGPTRVQSSDTERAPTRGAPTQTSREALEQLVGAPVTVLTVSTIDHHHGILPQEVQTAGYLGVFTLEDRLNYNHVDEDFHALGRSALYTVEGVPLPARTYDPYWRLHQARDSEGWLVDSARVVTAEPEDSERDITPALLGERFAKVAEVGDVWRATPDEVIDYILMRRAAHPRGYRATDAAITFSMEAPRIPERAQNRELTFTMDVPPAWQTPLVTSDGAPVTDVAALSEGRIRFTLPVHDGQQMRISAADSA
ncbi:MAG: hypothetical protein OXM03_10900 [Chloroflexota bacterium]|nr:hypothetical protein [Chloroflexota bacterium]